MCLLSHKCASTAQPPSSFQVPPATSSPPSSSGSSRLATEEYDEFFPSNKFSVAHIKLFFDGSTNMMQPPPLADTGPSTHVSTDSSPSPRRTVHVKGFGTIATSAEDWHPALIQSVCPRRTGPIARAASPVLNPTMMVPDVAPKPRPSGGSSGINCSQNAINCGPALCFLI